MLFMMAAISLCTVRDVRAKPALSFTSVISFIHSKITDNIHLDLYCLLSKIINLQTTVYSQD